MKKPVFARIKPYPSNNINRLLQWLIACSAGGVNRGRIIQVLKEKPCSANRLTELLGFHGTTARFHLDVLERNDLVTSKNGEHGKIYVISSFLEKNFCDFEEIWERMATSDKPPFY